MIYLERAKEALPKGAVGNYGMYSLYYCCCSSNCYANIITPTDTTHRLFLASLLLASKFLEEDMETNSNNSPIASIPRLNGKRLRDLCGGIYTLKDINTFELSFLKLIKYRCWVDQDDVESFLRRNSVELQLYWFIHLLHLPSPLSIAHTVYHTSHVHIIIVVFRLAYSSITTFDRFEIWIIRTQRVDLFPNNPIIDGLYNILQVFDVDQDIFIFCQLRSTTWLVIILVTPRVPSSLIMILKHQLITPNQPLY